MLDRGLMEVLEDLSSPVEVSALLEAAGLQVKAGS